LRTYLCAAAVLFTGCESPTDPSAATEDVVIYADPDFRGESRRITADVLDLEDIAGGCYRTTALGSSRIDWDDCISSIRVGPGWTVTVYEDPRYTEASLPITADVPDLEDVPGPCDGWDDCVSSIRVSRR
jgi:hypothetical protein